MEVVCCFGKWRTQHHGIINMIHIKWKKKQKKKRNQHIPISHLVDCGLSILELHRYIRLSTRQQMLYWVDHKAVTQCTSDMDPSMATALLASPVEAVNLPPVIRSFGPAPPQPWWIGGGSRGATTVDPPSSVEAMEYENIQRSRLHV